MKDNPERKPSKAATTAGLWSSVKNRWEQTTGTLEKWFWGDSTMEIHTEKQECSQIRTNKTCWTTNSIRGPREGHASWKQIKELYQAQKKPLMTVNYHQGFFVSWGSSHARNAPEAGFSVCSEYKHSVTLRADNQKPHKNLKNTCHELPTCSGRGWDFRLYTGLKRSAISGPS